MTINGIKVERYIIHYKGLFLEISNLICLLNMIAKMVVPDEMSHPMGTGIDHRSLKFGP